LRGEQNTKISTYRFDEIYYDNVSICNVLPSLKDHGRHLVLNIYCIQLFLFPSIIYNENKILRMYIIIEFVDFQKNKLKKPCKPKYILI